MRYAIENKGTLKRPGARAIKENWPLTSEESFTAEYKITDRTVVAEDNQSLRELTDQEVQARLDEYNSTAARIDRAFPQTDVAQVLIEVFTELANRIKELENPGSPPYTKQQIKAWLKNKLP